MDCYLYQTAKQPASGYSLVNIIQRQILISFFHGEFFFGNPYHFQPSHPIHPNSTMKREKPQEKTPGVGDAVLA
jgi:hypothetical protein